jgi:hypothetical protein
VSERSGAVLTGRRIAIVCGHFVPELGYQEVDLAAAFARLGATTRVVTSTRRSPNARAIGVDSYTEGLHAQGAYEVLRLPTRLAIGSNLVGGDVRPALAEFRPDAAILVGPGKLFGLEIFSETATPYRRIAVIQDNSEDGRSRAQYGWRGRLKAVAHRLVKQPAYRRVVRHADRVILNVPETQEIVRPWLGADEQEDLRHKAVQLRLGFDPSEFYFESDERAAWRSEHGIAPHEVVLVTCTRATPSKRLEDVIDAVSRLRRQGLALRYVLSGLLDDSYAQTLRAHAARQPEPDAVLLLPLLDHDAMRVLFAGSDLGFWSQAAISIQQAMGTGLPVVLRDRPTVSHLLQPGVNGWYGRASESTEELLEPALRTLSVRADADTDRSRTAALNRGYLSYDHIAVEMLSGL